MDIDYTRYSSDSEEYNHKPPRSHYDNFQSPYHYHRPPEMFAPPIPDPRAQFIITQAMHQLSALVGTPWIPPYDPSFIPHTPSRRHQSRRAYSVFNTPNHPYQSFPTLPPESPDPISSPEKLSSSSHGPRKSSMARARSRSRGRQVSFEIDRSRSTITTTWPSKGKGKSRVETSDGESSMDESPCRRDRKNSYLRGQTPGPEVRLPKVVKKSGQDSKRRLKGSLDFAA